MSTTLDGVCASTSCGDPSGRANRLYCVLQKDRDAAKAFFPRVAKKIEEVENVGVASLGPERLRQLQKELGMMMWWHMELMDHGRRCGEVLIGAYRTMEAMCAPQDRHRFKVLAHDHYHRYSTTPGFVEHAAGLLGGAQISDSVMWRMELVRSAVHQRHDEVRRLNRAIDMYRTLLQAT